MAPLIPGSGARSTAPGSGLHRPDQLPARRVRQGGARDLLRVVPRREARAARHGHLPALPAAPPRPQTPRPGAARMGFLDRDHDGREGSRLVAAVLRAVHVDDVGRHRTGGVRGRWRPHVRRRLGAGVQGIQPRARPRAGLARSVEARVDVWVPGDPELVRDGVGRRGRHRPRLGNPDRIPSRRPTSSSPRSPKSSACSAPPR